jgi:hypothetical protein
MNSLAIYDNIEVGDTITFPKSMNLVKSGVVASTRKWNGNAMRVTCTNGAIFEISRYTRDYVLTVEEN